MQIRSLARLAGIVATAAAVVACATSSGTSGEVRGKRKRDDILPELPADFDRGLFRRITESDTNAALRRAGEQRPILKPDGSPDRGNNGLTVDDLNFNGVIDHRDSFYTAASGLFRSHNARGETVRIMEHLCELTESRETRFSESVKAFMIRTTAPAWIEIRQDRSYETLRMADGTEVASWGNYDLEFLGCLENEFGIHLEAARDHDPSRLASEVLAIYKDAKGWGAQYANLAPGGGVQPANLSTERIVEIYRNRTNHTVPETGDEPKPMILL